MPGSPLARRDGTHAIAFPIGKPASTSGLSVAPQSQFTHVDSRSGIKLLRQAADVAFWGEDAQVMPDRESTIGSFVRARRRANGLTQRELAELAGVGTRVVSEIERGKPTLRMDVVNSVLGVFGKCLGIDDARRNAGGAAHGADAVGT